MVIELRKLSAADGRDAYDMLQEFPNDENGFINPIAGQSFEFYKKWLSLCIRDAQQAGVVDGWKVPQSTYWLFADGRPVGMGKIRHFLTDKLLMDGGHIGYAIRPSERKKGFGTRLLAELVKECGRIGVDKALLTIHNDNIPSIKVALANNGIIEKSSDRLQYIWIACVA